LKKTHTYGDQCWHINIQITAKHLHVYIFNRTIILGCCWKVHEWRFNPHQGQEISNFFISSRAALTRNKPPIQCVPEKVSLGIKQPGCKVNISFYCWG